MTKSTEGVKNLEKEFDIDLYYKIIEKMAILESKMIIVTLLDGTEIEVLR